jgi:peptidoglycan hydrolase-like protein with peptidoglycan-binding domain
MTTTPLHNEDNNISNESATRGRRRIGITASIAAAAAVATVATALSLGAFVTPASASSSPTPAHVTKVTPARSAAVAKLQRELAQLNYYIGPLDGIMGPQTIAAITYLQRDAGLARTGYMNPQTEAALAYFLAHGNNHMGG